MALNPIAIAVPFFFLLMALELGIARKRNRRLLRLNDALCDMGCGLGEQTLGIFTKGLILADLSSLGSRFVESRISICRVSDLDLSSLEPVELVEPRAYRACRACRVSSLSS